MATIINATNLVDYLNLHYFNHDTSGTSRWLLEEWVSERANSPVGSNQHLQPKGPEQLSWYYIPPQSSQRVGRAGARACWRWTYLRCQTVAVWWHLERFDWPEVDSSDRLGPVRWVSLRASFGRLQLCSWWPVLLGWSFKWQTGWNLSGDGHRRGGEDDSSGAITPWGLTPQIHSLRTSNSLPSDLVWFGQ